jgi:hypothetical protein
MNFLAPIERLLDMLNSEQLGKYRDTGSFEGFFKQLG